MAYGTLLMYTYSTWSVILCIEFAVLINLNPQSQSPISILNLNPQSQSRGSLFKETWHKRPRERNQR